MILSILICTLSKRNESFSKLIIELHKQISEYSNGNFVSETIKHGAYYLYKVKYENIEIIACGDEGGLTIGTKRNILMKEAQGEYVCYHDDDDLPLPAYIKEIMKGCESGKDCCSFIGLITFDGLKPKPFIHSLKYNKYFETDTAYFRPPNHLNCIKKEFASQIPFHEKNFSEDTDFAMTLCRSGLLKTEHEITTTIYYYDFKTVK